MHGHGFAALWFAIEHGGAWRWLFEHLKSFFFSTSTVTNYLKFGLGLTVTFVLEVAARKNWRVRYGTKAFRVDILYFVFYYAGFYHVFFFTYLYAALMALTTRYAPFLQLNLLNYMSPPMQMAAMILTSDFVGYWNHRWRHSNAYTWAFHSIHHSDEHLTVATNYRFHFVDETLLRLWLFIPFQLLGTSVTTWLTLDFIMAWIFLVQHSEWDWTYGRLGWIFVSPTFHRRHHSIDMRQANSNYGMLFTFWDDLFGTADRTSPLPTQYGVAGPPVRESFLAQLVAPLKMIAAHRRSLRDTAVAPAAASTSGLASPGTDV
jgi:sterol desaturase/sphingolipid hydroxylase (fatty acid hydroxylase superfamily)